MTFMRWIPALVFSLAVHLAAAMLFHAPGATVEVAGGALAEVSVLGNAFEDMRAAGAEETVVATSEAETVEPERPDVLQAAQPIAAEAVEADLELEIAETVAPEEVVLTVAEAIAPDAPNQPAEPIAAEPAIVSPVETMSETTEAPVPPIRTVPSVPREQLYPQSQQQGSGGEASADATRGGATGSQTAAAPATQSQPSPAAPTQGNAAVSNYPGQVATLLRRALRYPSAARGATGEAQVQFTVNASGALVSAVLARSTGNAILDRAALETVRRAAPFPPIPAEANRSEWTFTMPLGFVN